MAAKKVCVMALCVFLLTLSFSGVGNAVSQETQTVTPLNYGGLKIEITAPVHACPGEEMIVTVKTSAVDVQQVHINSITLELYGVKTADERVVLVQIDHLEDVDLSIHQTNYTVTIPDDIAPGLTYGEVSCDWEALNAPFEIQSSGFVSTYIENVVLQQLQEDYDELSAAHDSLLEDYNQLNSEVHGDPDSTRTLMYVFIITTVVASITVFVLLMRKPKKVWV
jgi:hypothetical protein